MENLVDGSENPAPGNSRCDAPQFAVRDFSPRMALSEAGICPPPYRQDFEHSFKARFLCWLFLAWLSLATALADDELELLSGTRIQGKILERNEQSIKIQITVNHRSLIRSYPINRVRSVTQNGEKKNVAQENPATSKLGSIPNSASTNSTMSVTDSTILQRSPEAVASLIEKMGRTPPDWFNETPLEFPNTLDLSWPEPAPIIWNYTRNVDHYIWDIVNTNPKRYPNGVRLMHHLLLVNQKNEGTRSRAMNELGRMYFEFFRDYARAAFWWREAKVEQNPKFSGTPSPAHLAECYWRLGSRAMAVDLLDRLPVTLAVIKAWGDLKEKDKALKLCNDGLGRGFLPTETYLLAGDVCRTSKDFAQATEFYRRTLEFPLPRGNKGEQIKRDQDRARATLEVIRLFDTLDVSKIANGTYPSKSLGYYGNLEVEAVTKDGKIDGIKVVHNPDRQYYHAVDETIRRIIDRQTVNGVDAISGATVTSEAIIRASAKALSEGMGTDSKKL